MTTYVCLSLCGIIVSLLGFGFTYFCADWHIKVKLCTLFSVLCGILLSLLVVTCAKGYEMDNEPPTALDVYRGKTALDINYYIVEGDTIKADSVVFYLYEL